MDRVPRCAGKTFSHRMSLPKTTSLAATQETKNLAEKQREYDACRRNAEHASAIAKGERSA
jgi:hypothetical protein